MARTSQNPRLINRTSRIRLASRRDPYWHLIAEGQHLGYRRTDTGGTWIARMYTRKHGRKFEALGAADDAVAANGDTILSFQQAQDAALKKFREMEAQQSGRASSSALTVAEAAQDWLDHFEGSERSKDTSDSNVRHYILPTLGDIEVRELTRKDIESWLHKTAKSKPLKVQRREAATKKLSPSRQSKIAYEANDPETIRKRRDTANRIFNDLRALLNRAADNDTALNRNVWESVDKFQNVGRASDSYLSVDEVPRFTQACDEDFRTLVQAAVVTGCRYDELCRLKVAAYDPNTATISLIQQKTGKMKRIFLTEDEVGFIETLCDAKASDDNLLLRSDGQPWGKSHQQDRMKAALGKAGIKRHIRFHDLRHTFASLLIQQGVALEVVSNQLGHSSTAITSKHYAHLSPEYIGKSVRDNKPSFGLSAVTAQAA